MQINEIEKELVPYWGYDDEQSIPHYWVMPIQLNGQYVSKYRPVNGVLLINDQYVADAESDINVEDLGMGDGWLVQFDCRSTVVLRARDYKKAEIILQLLTVELWDDRQRTALVEYDITVVGSVTSLNGDRLMRLNRDFTLRT